MFLLLIRYDGSPADQETAVTGASRRNVKPACCWSLLFVNRRVSLAGSIRSSS